MVSKTKSSIATLREIQGIFEEDKGWDSEQSMIQDMAQFRMERIKEKDITDTELILGTKNSLRNRHLPKWRFLLFLYINKTFRLL